MHCWTSCSDHKKTPTINVWPGPQPAAQSSSNVSQRACACYNLGCVQLFAVLHFLDGLLQQAVCPSQVSHEGDVSLKRIHQKTYKGRQQHLWDINPLTSLASTLWPPSFMTNFSCFPLTSSFNNIVSFFPRKMLMNSQLSRVSHRKKAEYSSSNSSIHLSAL